jgi:3-oxoacyl-[acyl-carrier protein] reductase
VDRIAKGGTSMSGLAGKSVLVTGGTRGIGRAIVRAFAEDGAKVALCGRDQDRAVAAAAELADETGGVVHGFEADIAKSEDVDALVTAATAACGPIQILVNNAGITRDGLLMRMKNEQWDEVIQTNLTGTFYTCRAVCRDMIKQRWGRIVNLSSIVGLRGQGGQTNYAAAKAGIVGFSKALAQELASRNVTVNVVAPGYIDTDMTAGFNDEARQKLLQTIPAGRVGAADDVAAAVRFLASEGAGYITGHVLCVDGGLGM